MGDSKEARKRKEASKKSAATRKANEEEKDKSREQKSEQKSEQESNELKTERASWGTESPEEDPKLGTILGVQKEHHRADVNPVDQAAQNEQRQRELEAEREDHNRRTAGKLGSLSA